MLRVKVKARGVTGLQDGSTELELPPGTTLEGLLDMVHPAKAVLQEDTKQKSPRNIIVMVNGAYVSAAEAPQKVLGTGDVVTLMPLILGG